MYQNGILIYVTNQISNKFDIVGDYFIYAIILTIIR
jgi:hypothetical protein